jgi:hypothetical protein
MLFGSLSPTRWDSEGIDGDLAAIRAVDVARAGPIMQAGLAKDGIQVNAFSIVWAARCHGRRG